MNQVKIFLNSSEIERFLINSKTIKDVLQERVDEAEILLPQTIAMAESEWRNSRRNRFQESSALDSRQIFTEEAKGGGRAVNYIGIKNAQEADFRKGSLQQMLNRLGRPVSGGGNK